MRALTVQIAGAFRVPPHKVGDLTNANYSNMAESELSYVTSSTLDPSFECWELAVRRDLLTARQYNAYIVQLDRASLVRNDVKSLHESLAVGRNTGFLLHQRLPAEVGREPDCEWPRPTIWSTVTAFRPVGAPREPTVV